MLVRFPAYAPLLMACTVVIAASAAVAFARREETTTPFIALLLGMGWWQICQLFELILPSRSSQIAWSELAYLGIATVPGLWLMFARSYRGTARTLPLWTRICYWTIPGVTIAVALAGNWHGAMWSSITAASNSPGAVLRFVHGAWWWIFVVYSYGLIAAGLITLVPAIVRLPRVFGGQVALLVVSVLFPWSINLLEAVGITLVPNLDLTPFAFSVSGAAWLLAILRFRMFDLIPVARETLIDNMVDGVLVLDRQQRVIDSNAAARIMIGKGSRELHGKDMQEAVPDWSAVLRALDAEVAPVLEVRAPANAEVLLEARRIALRRTHGVTAGELIVLRDVSARAHVEMELRNLNRELQRQAQENELLQARLRDQTLRDALTGLYNRRVLNDDLPQELACAMRVQQPVALVMIDLDHFKMLNDRFGHLMGDEVLHMVGALLSNQVRQGDTCCRYGGEEFMVVLPGVSAAAAIARVDLWRQLLADMPVVWQDDVIRVTFSAGIAHAPDDGETLEALTRAADEALYAAKRTGRNRVVRWTEDLAAPDRAGSGASQAVRPPRRHLEIERFRDGLSESDGLNPSVL